MSFAPFVTSSFLSAPSAPNAWSQLPGASVGRPQASHATQAAMPMQQVLMDPFALANAAAGRSLGATQGQAVQPSPSQPVFQFVPARPLVGPSSFQPGHSWEQFAPALRQVAVQLGGDSQPDEEESGEDESGEDESGEEESDEEESDEEESGQEESGEESDEESSDEEELPSDSPFIAKPILEDSTDGQASERSAVTHKRKIADEAMPSSSSPTKRRKADVGDSAALGGLVAWSAARANPSSRPTAEIEAFVVADSSNEHRRNVVRHMLQYIEHLCPSTAYDKRRATTTKRPGPVLWDLFIASKLIGPLGLTERYNFLEVLGDRSVPRNAAKQRELTQEDYDNIADAWRINELGMHADRSGAVESAARSVHERVMEQQAAADADVEMGGVDADEDEEDMGQNPMASWAQLLGTAGGAAESMDIVGPDEE